MSEYKIALFGSGGKAFDVKLIDRGGEIVVDGTICVAYMDGAV
jgi:hypothetical protein